MSQDHSESDVNSVTIAARQSPQVLRDSFRKKWESGQSVCVEEFIQRWAPEQRDSMLVPLLEIEVDQRRRQGDVVDMLELLNRFPADVDMLQRQHARLIGSRERSNSSTVGLPMVDRHVQAEFESTLPAVYRGSRLGRYILNNQVGTGSFGEVWEAVDPELTRTVAVKTPRTGSWIDETTGEQFVSEGQKAAQLDHANIVTVHDTGIDNGRCYIVSQFVDGGTLRERIRQGVMPIDAAVDCTLKLAEALHFAHQKGIVHRDMKPGNVLLTRSGEPLIADFGLAKFEAVNESSLALGQIAGTPAYMAPEQVLTGANGADARSDIFSLGVMLNEMLTGLKPDVGTSALQLREHHLKKERLPLPSENRADVPAELDQIFAKATSRDPETRYASAAELANDLRALQTRQATIPDPGQTQPSGRLTRTSKLSLAAIGVVAFSVAAAVMFLNKDASLDAAALNDGRVEVRIATDPPGATVTFIPLKSDTGFPQPELSQTASLIPYSDASLHELEDLRSNDIDVGEFQSSTLASARLKPGKYLVVVEWDKVNFHEVYRTVPAPDVDSRMTPYYHMFWRRFSDGTVRLPKVELTPHHLVSRMSPLQTIAEVRDLDVYGPNGPIKCLVPAFKLAKQNLNWEQYLKRYGTSSDGRFVEPAIPRFLRTNPELLRQVRENESPVVCLTWNQAMQFAEDFGMRLPEELELEAAARQQLLLPEDDRDIHGLDEEPSEWSVNRATAMPVPFPPGAQSSVGVMSSTTNRVHRGPAVVTSSGVELKRGFVDRGDGTRTDVGIRFAKSVRPRLKPQDLIHVNESPKSNQ